MTEKEKTFIKEYPNHSVCVTFNQFPLDGYEDGKMIGIMSDIYKLIAQKSSLKFQAVASDSQETLRQNLLEKKCDLLSVYAPKSEQYPMLQSTKRLFSTHFTLISSLDKAFIEDVNSLRGKVVLTQFASYKSYLHKLYPFLNIKVVQETNEMVNMLLKGEAYTLVTIDEQADYLIDKYGYGKLKINGFLLKDKKILLSIGVQKEQKILLGIINKALDSISKNTLLEIVNSWRLSRYHTLTDYSLVYTILVIMGIILLIMAYYHKKLKDFNKKLEKSVDEKTKALREMNEHLEESVAQKVAALIQKDEILTVQSKQAVMGEMISMIAHQWRQPLNGITLQISNLQIKQMMQQKLDEEELQKTLESINETITYLSETIDDFKTYFHPNKAKELAVVDDVIKKAMSFVETRAKSNGVEIRLVNSSEFRMQLYPNELLQVLLNILSNAIDAYGSVVSDKKVIEIETSLSEASLSIGIKDYAGGISRENISKIFEPYFSTKGKNGTGLGLYMSQMIIEKQFNGTILVKSSKGSTTFTVELPRV